MCDFRTYVDSDIGRDEDPVKRSKVGLRAPRQLAELENWPLTNITQSSSNRLHRSLPTRPALLPRPDGGQGRLRVLRQLKCVSWR